MDEKARVNHIPQQGGLNASREYISCSTMPIKRETTNSLAAPPPAASEKTWFHAYNGDPYHSRHIITAESISVSL